MRLIPAGPIPYLTVLASVLLIVAGTTIVLDAWSHDTGWWRLIGLGVVALGVGCMVGNPFARFLSIALACFGLVQFLKTGLIGGVLACAIVAVALLAAKRGQR